MKEQTFRNYQLSPEIIKAIELLNYKKPTEVQEKVIPNLLNSRDIIVKSQTGSGKTASFAIPISESVDWDENKPQALVLTPTRELAIQVGEDFFNIGRFKRLKVPVIYGKASYRNQERDLKQKAHVVVGTPGRIIDHLEKGIFDVSKIKYLVIDEADEMLSMGFMEQIETIIKVLPKNRITALLSATMPADIEKLCKKYMKTPEFVEIESKSTTADRIEQEVYFIEREWKFKLLEKVSIVENPDCCIVFCNTKQTVDNVKNHLDNLDFSCDRVHGGMEQRDRLRVMDNFRLGKFRYLIATDVAARGIDVENVTHVINYDIPLECDSYVHRIGRTGRFKNKGKAITFVLDSQKRFLDNIEEYISKEIAVVKEPSNGQVASCRDEFYKKMSTIIKPKKKKGSELNKGITKIHINAGKKTKMRPVDIVGTLCNIEGMTSDDIGIINIVDVSTFVEILNNKGDMVIRALKNKPIKGKIRKVSKEIGRRRDVSEKTESPKKNKFRMNRSR